MVICIGYIVVLHVSLLHIYVAPSTAPTSVSVSEVTSSSITVQWGAVDCIHRNGDITGYSVRYGVQGSAEGDRTVEMVSGDSSGGMYVISGLSAATVYTVEVAAVNRADTGVYSDPVTFETPASKSTHIGCMIMIAYISSIPYLSYIQVCISVSMMSTSLSIAM